jgi:DNA uptake protein ComE-like DNA-binding protein
MALIVGAVLAQCCRFSGSNFFAVIKYPQASYPAAQNASGHFTSRHSGDNMKRIIALAAALLIGAAGTAYAQKQEAPKPAAAPAKAAPAPAAAAETKKEPMDINTATEKELASLPKIGDVYSKAIVKGRPYNGKDDLVNKKIIPQATYDAIKDLIIAKQPKKDEPKKDAKTK